MKLEKGKTYKVVESLGMMLLQGKYIGRARRGGCDTVLVFETMNSQHSKFFSATWHFNSSNLASEEQPTTFLISKHYSDSIEELGVAKRDAYQLID